jgi:mono/diheme cytochrome c family protein
MQKALLLLTAMALLACKPESEPSTEQTPLSGRQIYTARCIACHQADGNGVPAICPPLKNSPRLAGPPGDLIKILLLGQKGPIVRDGVKYNGLMPSWKFDLTDEQIAAVINDLSIRWHPGAQPVTEEMVGQIREQTAGENLFPAAQESGLSD